MRYCISFVFLFHLFSTLQGQVLTGRVIDANTKLPIPFAHITITGTRHGTSADIDGRFSLSLNIPAKITVSSIGYTTTELEVLKNDIVIELKEAPVELREIVVTPQENPAHKIMRKAQLNKSKNDPNSLPSYTFNSYNKLYIKLSNEATAYSKDSTLRTRMDTSELFVSESVVIHKFKKPDKVHEHIQAHKTSGLKNPLLASVLTDFQPMSFYDDWFFMNATDKYYLNPLHDENFQKYEVEMLDTLYTNADSTFVVSFQPQSGKNFEGLKGVIYINSNGYAIENVVAGSCNETDGIGFTLQQKYQFVHGHWFPVQLNTDVFIQDKKNLLYGVRYVHKSYFTDIHLNVAFSKNDFPSVTRDLAEDVSDKGEVFWDTNRADSLSLKEANTYAYFDRKPDKYLNSIFEITEYLSTGFIHTRKVDVPINNLMAFNKYEGCRLGIGAETNKGISKTIRVGGYIGWGVNDEAFKFGGNIRVHANNPARTSVNFFYQQDVAEPASTSMSNEENAILKNGYRGLLASRMDSIQRFGSTLASFLHPNLNLNVSLLRETRIPTYDYHYGVDDNVQETYRTNEVALSLRYTLGEKRLSMSSGVLTTVKPSTHLEIKVAKGLGFANKDLGYLKVHSFAAHRFNTKLLGITSLYAEGGFVEGNLPYPYLFNGRGTSQEFTSFYIPNTFQTMGIYEFMSDRYASFFIAQNFGSFLFKSKTRYSMPEFELIHGVYWGRLSNIQKHQLIDLKVPAKGYFEGGVIVNKILRLRYLRMLFFDLGMGAFYRYGPYAYRDPKDNLVYKLIIGVSL